MAIFLLICIVGVVCMCFVLVGSERDRRVRRTKPINDLYREYPARPFRWKVRLKQNYRRRVQIVEDPSTRIDDFSQQKRV